MRTATLLTISSLLGHYSIKSTARRSHFHDRHTFEAADWIDLEIAKAMEKVSLTLKPMA
jgi:hypothetical protein